MDRGLIEYLRKLDQEIIDLNDERQSALVRAGRQEGSGGKSRQYFQECTTGIRALKGGAP